MIHSICFFVKTFFSLLGTLTKRRKIQKLEETEKWLPASKIVRNWARGIIKYAGVEIEVIGKPRTDCPTVFIGNHAGYFDIPICLSIIERPIGFVSKIENKKIPIIHGWMKAIGCVFIDRSDIRQQVKMIDIVGKNLKAGHSYVIFPEGTRSKDGKLAEFKAGALKFATRAQASIQPFAIIGSADIMKKGSLRINSGKIIVKFGEPFDTDKKMNKETVALAERLRTEVEKLLDSPKN